MTCTHVHIGDACVTICGSRMVELRRIPNRVRWCFRCRKHLMHDLVLLGDPEPSYYEPTPAFRCHGCNEDHTLGFGMERVWDE